MKSLETRCSKIVCNKQQTEGPELAAQHFMCAVYQLGYLQDSCCRSTWYVLLK